MDLLSSPAIVSQAPLTDRPETMKGAVPASFSFQTAIALLALLYLLDIAALLTLIPERRGLALT